MLDWFLDPHGLDMILGILGVLIGVHTSYFAAKDINLISTERKRLNAIAESNEGNNTTTLAVTIP